MRSTGSHDIGERTGSGIPNIFRVWREQGWAAPAITEQLEPERTILALTLMKGFFITTAKFTKEVRQYAESSIRPRLFW